MKKNKRTCGAVIITVFLLFLSVFSCVFAQQESNTATGVGVSPVKIEGIVDPGEVLEETIKVTNESDAEKTMYAYIRDFKAGGETGSAEIIAPGSEPGPYLSSWIDITKEGISFQPREQKEVRFKVNVPSNQGPGGYYGAILFGAEPPKIRANSEDKGALMSIVNQTGALILLRVKGEVLDEANIREFSTEKEVYGTPFNVKFQTRIENTGNVFIKPIGKITVKNMVGKEVASLPFNDSGSNILQDQIRRFDDFWQGDKGFGRYTASLIISYGAAVDEGGNGKQTLFMDKTFWIMPWRILLPGLAAIILIGVLIFVFFNSYKNKAVKRAMEQMGIAQTRYVRKFEGPSPALHLAIIVSSLLFAIFMIIVIIFFIFFA